MSPSSSQGSDLYSHLTPELRSLVLRGVVHTYPKKTLLINEGEEGDHLFVLLQGSVKVFSTDQNGREITYGKINAGDYFGEMSLDGGPRSASVMTLDVCTCAVLTRFDVSEHLAVEPGFAINLVVQVIRRARSATEIAKNMALRDVYSRLVDALESQAANSLGYSPVGEDAYPLTLEPITHQDIAARIGASREMVSRLLKDLEKGGNVIMSTKKIVMLRKLPTRW